MAMTVKNISSDPSTSTEESIEIKIWNGELKALNDIQEKWNFKDKESLLRFAIAILAKSSEKIITVHDKGEKVTLEPADELLKPKESTSGQQ